MRSICSFYTNPSYYWLFEVWVSIVDEYQLNYHFFWYSLYLFAEIPYKKEKQKQICSAVANLFAGKANFLKSQTILTFFFFFTTF